MMNPWTAQKPCAILTNCEKPFNKGPENCCLQAGAMAKNLMPATMRIGVIARLTTLLSFCDRSLAPVGAVELNGR
jgi:hypothetical protein